MNGRTNGDDQIGIMIHAHDKFERIVVPTPRNKSILIINSTMLTMVNTAYKSIQKLYILYFDAWMRKSTSIIITNTIVGDKMKTKLTSWKNVNIANKISSCCVTIAHMRYIKKIIR